MKSSPFVDRLVITGEGYLKKVWDGLDQFKDEDTPKNSYEISGAVIKGTLFF